MSSFRTGEGPSGCQRDTLTTIVSPVWRKGRVWDQAGFRSRVLRSGASAALPPQVARMETTPCCHSATSPGPPSSVSALSASVLRAFAAWPWRTPTRRLSTGPSTARRPPPKASRWSRTVSSFRCFFFFLAGEGEEAMWSGRGRLKW